MHFSFRFYITFYRLYHYKYLVSEAYNPNCWGSRGTGIVSSRPAWAMENVEGLLGTLVRPCLKMRSSGMSGDVAQWKVLAKCVRRLVQSPVPAEEEHRNSGFAFLASHSCVSAVLRAVDVHSCVLILVPVSLQPTVLPSEWTLLWSSRGCPSYSST